MGLPDCDLALAQAAVYLAFAPKSNALYLGLGKARKDVMQRPNEPVPRHLRNASTSLMRDLGYGKGYQYAHDFKAGVAVMDCLPPSMKGRRYYQPKEVGAERELTDRLKQIRRTKGESDGRV